MARQQKIPGSEQETNREVEVAAQAYVKARNKRCKQSEEEAFTKQALIDLMKKAGLSTYKDEDDGLIITLASKDNVRVTEVDDEQDDIPRGRSAAAASAGED